MFSILFTISIHFTHFTGECLTKKPFEPLPFRGPELVACFNLSNQSQGLKHFEMLLDLAELFVLPRGDSIKNYMGPNPNRPLNKLIKLLDTQV